MALCLAKLQKNVKTGHEKQNHNVLREPYGRLCVSCVDEKNESM